MNKEIKKLKSFYAQLTPPSDKIIETADSIQNAITKDKRRLILLISVTAAFVALLFLSVSLLNKQKEHMEKFRVESIIIYENHTAIWLEPISKSKKG